MTIYIDHRLYNQATTTNTYRYTTNFIKDTPCVTEFDHEIIHRINYALCIRLCELCLIFIAKMNLELYCSVNHKQFFSTAFKCCQASFHHLEKRFIPVKISS